MQATSGRREGWQHGNKARSGKESTERGDGAWIGSTIGVTREERKREGERERLALLPQSDASQQVAAAGEEDQQSSKNEKEGLEGR
ncbi:hypothetical protein Q9L58_010978, partial [Maublancomyces gigas]